jgi:hypothetical protein
VASLEPSADTVKIYDHLFPFFLVYVFDGNRPQSRLQHFLFVSASLIPSVCGFVRFCGALVFHV